MFGTCEGSFAEYAAAREDKLAIKPAISASRGCRHPDLGHDRASRPCVTRAGWTQVTKVLIIGAGGGVGTFSVQLAKAFGAEVTGVPRPKWISSSRSGPTR